MDMANDMDQEEQLVAFVVTPLISARCFCPLWVDITLLQRTMPISPKRVWQNVSFAQSSRRSQVDWKGALCSGR